MNERRESGREGVPGKTVGDESADVFLCQKAERNLPGCTASLEIELERKERVLRDLKLGRPVGRHDHEACLTKARESVAQHVDRRSVGPVDVLDEQNQRLARACHLEERGELSLQSFLG